MPRQLIDIQGCKFGTLTVISRAEGTHEAKWLCRCDCGRERVYVSSKLRRGDVACVCSGGYISHGMIGDPLYAVWTSMRARCNNKNNAAFHYYGGRGISVCYEWQHDFAAFQSWAVANGWAQGLEIDRKDNDGNYAPDNCRFVTPKVNCRNKRNNVAITFNGETRLLVEWSEHLGIPMKVLHNRIRTYGWTVERALSTPHMSVKEAAQHRFRRNN